MLAVASADPVMSLLGPIGLAASVGTALIVDLGSGSKTLQARTLADIAEDGPRLDELAPGRSGVAMISAGALSLESAAIWVERLAAHWPAIVIRPGPHAWPGPTVPLVPLYPGWLAPAPVGAAVWQPVPGGSRPSGSGPVLPALGAGLARRMLGGSLPVRSRWVRSWAVVWDLPWA